jgi:uncharacterized damage-inducible protein DinB
MSETRRIADQLERSYAGPAWHGPSISELLAGLDAVAAAARPLSAAHTIWELVRHITVWIDVPRRRIEGESIDDPPAEVDWPTITDSSPAAWRTALAELASAHQRLHDTILGLDEERLADPTSGSGPTVWHMLHGVVQHNVYHAGQIGLLKKALAAAARP